MVNKRKKHNKKMHVCKGIRDKGSETAKSIIPRPIVLGAGPNPIRQVSIRGQPCINCLTVGYPVWKCRISRD